MTHHACWKLCGSLNTSYSHLPLASSYWTVLSPIFLPFSWLKSHFHFPPKLSSGITSSVKSFLVSVFYAPFVFPNHLLPTLITALPTTLGLVSYSVSSHCSVSSLGSPVVSDSSHAGHRVHAQKMWILDVLVVDRIWWPNRMEKSKVTKILILGD